jgi:hypothetical protein
MAMEDVLSQAFTGLQQQPSNMTAAFSSAGNIVNTAMQTDAQMQMHQQTLQLQRQQLQQQYLGKAAETMEYAGKDDTPQSVREQLVQQASRMAQMGGASPFSQEFQDRFKDTPEFRQSSLDLIGNYRKAQSDPFNPDAQTSLLGSLHDLTQIGPGDVPQALRQADTANKGYNEVLARGMQGNIKLQNAAALNQFKNSQDAINKVSAGELSRSYLQKPLPDPNVPTKSLLDANGKPITMMQAGNRLAMIQSEKATPDNNDSKINTAFQIQSGQALNDEQNYQAQKKMIMDTKAAAAGVSTTGMSAADQSSLKTLLKAQVNPQNVDKLATMAQPLLSQLSTVRDNTTRNRQLEDTAQGVMTSVSDKMQAVNKATLPSINNLKQMQKLIQDPNTTVADLNARVAGMSSDLNDNLRRFSDNEVQRVSGLNAIQQATMFVQSHLGNLPDAQLNQGQRDVLSKAIKDGISTAKSTVLGDLYNQYKSLDTQNGSPVGPKLGSARTALTNAMNLAAGADGKITTSDLSAAYKASLSKLPSPNYSDQDRKNDMVQHALDGGFNPMAVENYFTAKARSKK